jgi:hypothetical protein
MPTREFGVERADHPEHHGAITRGEDDAHRFKAGAKYESEQTSPCDLVHERRGARSQKQTVHR